MKTLLGVICAFLLQGLPVNADLITRGLELSPAASAAGLTVLPIESEVAADQIVVRVGAENTKNMKGYGFVLTFDSAQFEYVGASESENSLIRPNGNQALLVHTNHEDGRVAVGAVQVDGSSASGEGDLVELTFRRVGTPVLGTGFQLTDGVVVDLAGKAAEVQPVSTQIERAAPSDFSLLQNVPNPFNPETSIAFEVPSSERVRLSIYTSLGQEIRTLVDEVRDPGNYTVRWDGRDSFGRQVASGVYFYRMEAGTFNGVKRMMLLK